VGISLETRANTSAAEGAFSDAHPKMTDSAKTTQAAIKQIDKYLRTVNPFTLLSGRAVSM
jgi:hypothetical protein